MACHWQLDSVKESRLLPDCVISPCTMAHSFVYRTSKALLKHLVTVEQHEHNDGPVQNTAGLAHVSGSKLFIAPPQRHKFS